MGINVNLQIGAGDERLRVGVLLARRRQAGDDRLDEVRPEALLVEGRADEVAEGLRGDLALLLHPVHVHPEADRFVPARRRTNMDESSAYRPSESLGGPDQLSARTHRV